MIVGLGSNGPEVDFDKGTVGGKQPDPELAEMAFGKKPWTAEKLALVWPVPQDRTVKSNKTLLIVGGAVIGLALLYFAFKDKR
jgi:hypothetical protein